MPDLIGKIGNVWTQLNGVPCPFCGSMKYTVTLRSETSTKSVKLQARCSECGRLKSSVRETETLLRHSPSPGGR